MQDEDLNPTSLWLVTPSTLPAHYPHSQIKESTVRYWLANAESNGFDTCVIRMGRRILIDLKKFEAWLVGNQQD